MNDTSNPVADQQPRPLAVAKPPSSCRLCNREISSPEAFRAHLKSDEHVRNLKAKVAETGSDSDTPALSSSANATVTTRKSKKGTRKPKYEAQVESEPEVDSESDLTASGEEDIDEDASISTPDFSPSECLFCSHDSSSPVSNTGGTEESAGLRLEANLSHMASSHGFIIPFQDCLAPDVTLDIIVEYLHFIIQGYRECISCGTRRSTVEGVQQHMIAKGHCRFDISPETEEFYEMPQLSTANIPNQDNTTATRLLPSGKLISSRQSLDPAGDAIAQDDPHRLARREKAAAARERKDEADAASPISSLTAPKAVPTPGFRTQRGAAQSASTEVAVTTRKGPNGEIIHQRSSEAILATQLSRLRIAGDRAQRREELRRRGRLESAGNEILRHHFRVSAGDSRFGKGFC
ncbi:C2H2 type zinc-finger (2 copies) domain containing protein [Naviculisporaceae sp. PSN 640]